jgi:hypothetical protein
MYVGNEIFPMDSFAPDYACCVVNLNQVNVSFVEFRILIRINALVLRRLVFREKFGPSESQPVLKFHFFAIDGYLVAR